ncbi:CHAD domain-containing protein [Terrabacter terrigena]|uniref:CHAD domain-containing protein n=1 Tax=Terrabacter terrigena TaxID=574718 RepID=A0ABW3N069_9MICO
MPSAASLVRQRLTVQREALTEAEEALLGGEPEGLHDVRVAIRRIRSALATFRPVLEPTVTDPLRDELRWVSGLLGQARDIEVVIEHTELLLAAAEPVGLDDAVTGLRARLRLDLAAAGDVVDETLASTRYAAVIALLDAAVTDPPFTAEADGGARKIARKRVEHDLERVVERIGLARATSDPEEQAARLHDVRKAAKRLRYAAEAAAPVAGSRIREIEEVAEGTQDVIGLHHDATVTRSTLRHLALDVESGEAAAFLLGHLDADEQRALRDLRSRAMDALTALEKLADDRR